MQFFASSLRDIVPPPVLGQTRPCRSSHSRSNASSVYPFSVCQPLQNPPLSAIGAHLLAFISIAYYYFAECIVLLTGSPQSPKESRGLRTPNVIRRSVLIWTESCIKYEPYFSMLFFGFPVAVVVLGSCQGNFYSHFCHTQGAHNYRYSNCFKVSL